MLSTMPDVFFHAAIMAAVLAALAGLNAIRPRLERAWERRTAVRRTRRHFGVLPTTAALERDAALTARVRKEVVRVGVIETATLGAPSAEGCRPTGEHRGSPTAHKEGVVFLIDVAGLTWDIQFGDSASELAEEAGRLAAALGVESVVSV
ncbi:MAG: hypothetical protein ACI9WU_000470 [Myxococcota bacterium]|jgi:hypothetical protein